MVVTFNVKNSEFDFYGVKDWRNQVEEWREEIENIKWEDAQELSYEKVVEMRWGEELFFAQVPKVMPRSLDPSAWDKKTLAKYVK